ncbi:ubiquitin carboxyl-terminal hydrolase 12-like isoform X2 [Papaver somniferum]|uniref:ubiquitin carboxyl-terminal hydrolase 12-like isoform X2 n=1 Tax=Papaver somniferum TaxID=3469 RepID=UPI000E6FBE26|nr:ubiquitin carboxyl-terminal hydrolase 12-like isoform X2 [Papaver somniferum]
MPFNRSKEMVSLDGNPSAIGWLKSENQTCRPYLPLTHEEEKPVGQLKRDKTIAAELIMLLESLELVSIYVPCVCNLRQKEIFFFFLAVMTLKKKKIRYVGNLFVNGNTIPGDILKILKDMANFAPQMKK